jgi:hypothetical protein
MQLTLCISFLMAEGCSVQPVGEKAAWGSSLGRVAQRRDGRAAAFGRSAVAAANTAADRLCRPSGRTFWVQLGFLLVVFGQFSNRCLGATGS